MEKLVSYSECIQAVQTKRSLYGKLYLKNVNTYETNNIPTYNCHISSRKTTYARQFRVRIMNAQLTPHKPFMIQSITGSDLEYTKFRARPVESPLSLLIWFKVIIESEHFETIGVSEATKIGEFVSLKTLGISGHIKERSIDGNTMMLTNGILLELNNASKLEKISNFRDRMIMYSSKRVPTLIDLQME